MSEPQESSYYEIALTNRQVLTAFVTLLIFLVVTFFCGVWVGRRGGRSDQGSLAQAVSPPPADVTAPPPVEKLDFFSAESAAAAKAEVPPPRSAPASPPPPAPSPSTLAQDLDAAAATAPATSPRAATSADEEEVEPRRTQPAPAPAVARPEAAPSSSAVVIQVFSSPDRQQAGSLVQSLAGSGFTAFVSPTEVSGQTMYRVRIGPFEDHEQAAAVARKIRERFKLDTWITAQ